MSFFFSHTYLSSMILEHPKSRARLVLVKVKNPCSGEPLLRSGSLGGCLVFSASALLTTTTSSLLPHCSAGWGRLKDDAVAMVEEQGDYTSFCPSLTMKSGVTGDGRTMSDCRATSSTPTVGQGPLHHLEDSLKFKLLKTRSL